MCRIQRRYLLPSLGLFLWAFLLQGQTDNTFQFITYSNKDGFNQNTVKAIERDKTGALWLGTSNGLIKYNGYSFNNMSWEDEHHSRVYHGPISSIISDSQGLLWIISSDGMNLYCPEMERFFKVTSDSLDMLFRTVEDLDGSMWVLGTKYLARVNASTSKDTVLMEWNSILLTGEHADLDILDLLQVDEENYLLATSTGLYKMFFSDGLVKNGIELEVLIPSTSITCLTLHNQLIWIGSEAGLHKAVLDGTKLNIIDKYVHIEEDPGSLAHEHITDILADSKDRLWIGTWRGGLSLLNEDRETFMNFTPDPKIPGRLSGNMINCLYEDPFNVLWIGTAQAGVCKLDLNRKPFLSFRNNPYDEQTIPGNLINGVLEDSEGYLWIATYGQPLARSTEPITDSNLSDMSFARFDRWYSTFPDHVIYSLYEDRYGYIWLGYENGVAVYNKRTAAFAGLVFNSEGKTLNISNVRNIAPVGEDRMMVSGSRIIVLQNPWRYLDRQKEVQIPVHCSQSFNDGRYITAVNVENPEKIWIGFGGQGLNRISMAEDSIMLVEHFEYIENDESSLSNNAVFSINRDADQSLWIGTFGGGLNRLINNSDHGNIEFERLRDTMRMADNAIYGILNENDSILWCGTDMGICRLNSRTFETTDYNMHDGLPNNNFRMNSYHKGQSGYYYFGGLNGLTAFRPDQIQANLIPPEVRLTNLMINNRKVPVGMKVDNRIILDRPISDMEELMLYREDNTISLEITVFHTAIPEKNSLSYMLEGFDEEWIHVNQGSFSPTYTSLPPGDYVFRVRGYNCDGIMSEEESSLQVTMMAPWYARPLSTVMIVLLALVAILAISRYLIKMNSLQNKLHFEQLDKERIKDINQAKLRFFTNISHEFKTPLSLISIPLQKLQGMIKSGEEKEYVDMIEKNSNRLIRLIDQLLTFRRIEGGRQSLEVSQTSMEDFIYPIADAFESFSLKKGIQFIYQVKDPAYRISLDLEKMEQVLFNLLSNAFKYTPANGKVRLEGSIRIIEGTSYACFDVTDNGAGVQSDERDRIFERFYQADSDLGNIGGTGIGLSYSKSIVELHNGTIGVESIPGEKTCFSVMLPQDEPQAPEPGKKEIRRLNADEMLEYEHLTANLIAESQTEDNLKPTALVVDDESEFRSIISNVLQKEYRILEAANGSEGLKIASKEEVDIIISDVMMPELNGYEFCNRVKTDMQLCHIPFVLLTALEEMDSHIRGMEHGADSYISKPFNLKYLEVTVQKLIENRKKLKAHFTQSSSLPADVQMSGIDADFIETVNKAIQDNLDDSSFGVEELAQQVSLSTSQLYRKLKLLTGQIPNAYLRNYRLQAAADILAGNPGISVKSVMYEVGIESASHFSHAFKKKFGYSPSEFS